MTVSAITIALIKVRIIFREFMEVRHAPALALPPHRRMGRSHRYLPAGQLLRRLSGVRLGAVQMERPGRLGGDVAAQLRDRRTAALMDDVGQDGDVGV